MKNKTSQEKPRQYCICCGKEIYRSNGRSAVKTRRALNSITCGRPCAKIYNRIYHKIRQDINRKMNKTKQEKIKKLIEMTSIVIDRIKELKDKIEEFERKIDLLNKP